MVKEDTKKPSKAEKPTKVSRNPSKITKKSAMASKKAANANLLKIKLQKANKANKAKGPAVSRRPPLPKINLLTIKAIKGLPLDKVKAAARKQALRNSVKAGRVRYVKKVKVNPNAYIEKPIGGEKNGGTRLIPVKKLPAYYASQLNKKKKIKHTKYSKRPLRSTLTPGTICILLAGIHKGKRVIFLKELAGGLCLITGPFKINSCPLRRVNQIYLLATSTKIDISTCTLPKRLNDKYFRRVRAPRAKKEEGDIFEQKEEKYIPSERRKKDQVIVDRKIFAAIKKREDKKFLFGYLGTPFGLKGKVYPHRLNF